MITSLGHHLSLSYLSTTEFLALFFQTFLKTISPPYKVKEIVKQLNFVAVESLPIIAFCVSAAAAVTILESSYHMKLVIQNDSLVPGFASLLILRELGAVIAALLITSRVGAGIAAEVGSMKVTEQIDALNMLGIDPIKFIVVPRFVACVLGGFMVTVIANVICLFVAMVVTETSLGYGSGVFISSMKTFVQYQDLLFSGIKGAVFGAIVPLVSCFYGFRCKAGAEGVGLATTNSVVSSSVLIIITDFILTWVFTFFY